MSLLSRPSAWEILACATKGASEKAYYDSVGDKHINRLAAKVRFQFAQKRCEVISATQEILTVHLEASHFDVLLDCCQTLVQSLSALRNLNGNAKKEVATESQKALLSWMQDFHSGRCMSPSERHWEAGQMGSSGQMGSAGLDDLGKSASQQQFFVCLNRKMYITSAPRHIDYGRSPILHRACGSMFVKTCAL